MRLCLLVAARLAHDRRGLRAPCLVAQCPPITAPGRLGTPCTDGTGPGTAGEDGLPSPDGDNLKFNGVVLEDAMNNPSYKGPGKYGTGDFANGSAAVSVDKDSEAGPFAASSNNATERSSGRSCRPARFQGRPERCR